MKSDPAFKLNLNMGNCLRKALKNLKGRRGWEDLVGYNSQQLKEHLESMFTEHINWNNYGKYWHIDHIIPKSLFNFTCAEDDQFKECWSLKNLQPLEAIENLKKGSRVMETDKRALINNINEIELG